MRARKFDLDTSKVNPFNYTKTRYLTRLFNSLSLLFPKGERFFMESIRHYEKIMTPELLAEAKLFYKEEANHSIQHKKLNDMLKQIGYNTDKLEAAALQRLNSLGNNPETRLMITCALEYFTQYGADLLKIIDPLIFKENEGSALWRWHAEEEAGEGHRTIAHSVLKHVNPDYSRAKFAFICVYSTLLLLAATKDNYVELSKKVA